jgi:hypothetical protein
MDGDAFCGGGVSGTTIYCRIPLWLAISSLQECYPQCGHASIRAAVEIATVLHLGYVPCNLRIGTTM